MLAFLIACTLASRGCGQFDIDYIPEPLPAWVDAHLLEQDRRFVNRRGLAGELSKERPTLRIGDITAAIPADADLRLGYERAIGLSPAGKKILDESDPRVSFELVQNGFKRTLIVDKGSNRPDLYLLDVVSPRADGKQFLAWEAKLTKLFGKPTGIMRTELPRKQQQFQRESEYYSAIEDHTLKGANHLSFAWIWAVGDPKTLRSEDIDYNDRGEQVAGPTYAVLLTYAEGSTAVDRKTGRRTRLPRILRLWINPRGFWAD